MMLMVVVPYDGVIDNDNDNDNDNDHDGGGEDETFS